MANFKKLKPYFDLVLKNTAIQKVISVFAPDESSDFDRDFQSLSRSPSKIAIGICGILFVLITTFLAIVGWQREYSDAYLATKAGIKSFSNLDQDWRVGFIKRSECSTEADCYQRLKPLANKYIPFETLTKPWRDIQQGVADGDEVYIMVRITLDKSGWKPFYQGGYKRLMLGMPTAWYDEASAYVNGDLMGRYLKNNRMGIPILIHDPEPQSIVIEVMYLKRWSYSGLFEPNDEPLLITTPGEYNSWVRMLVMQSASRGSWVSDLAFIVMGAFFLLLFLFVDRSPEVMGLALFVSLDAFSRSLNYGWLPWAYIEQLGDTVDSAGQIFRLYFLLQLGRIGSSRIGPWLIGAAIYSVVVSFGSWAEALNWKIIANRTYELNVWVSLIIALIGVAISVPTAIKLRRKQLPFRQWALILAAVACLLQVVAYVNNIYPEISNYKEFFQFRSVILPVSVYLLASSAFVNISTLENRVRSLSSAQAKTNTIERELELGRVVQNAYMKIPDLPPEIDMSCHFEAAFYVSGDSYFVHWDAETSRLAVILGDMTGHGVHAALKATTLQVIARTIFRDPMRRSKKLGDRFIVYENALRSFLRESWGDGDLPTFLGVELDISTGRVVSHRANFPYPLLVFRGPDGVWDVKVLTEMDTPIDFGIKNGQTFIVSATDGVIGGSKQLSKMAQRLKVQLNLVETVNAGAIRDQVLFSMSALSEHVDDDKTMIVFGLKSPNKAA